MNELLHVFNPEGVKVRTLGQLNYRSERMQAAFAQVDHDYRPDEFDRHTRRRVRWRRLSIRAR